MKRGFLGFIVCMMALLIGGCATHLRPVMKSGDGNYSDNRLDQIIDAINRKDSKAIKAMFSEEALAEAENIDNGIAYLFDFVQGEIVSTEEIVRGSTRTDVDYGDKTKWMISWYYANTSDQKYLVFFRECMTDTKKPENEGVYMIQVIKAEDKGEQFDAGGPSTLCAGIYMPPE